METDMNSPMDRRASGDFAAYDVDVGIGRYAASFGIALGITSLVNALLVVLKETYQTTVLAAMTAATGHHWVSQGVIDLAVFLVLGLALGRTSDRWNMATA